MTAAVYIYYTPSWQELADLTLPVVHDYCAKHNYKPFIHESKHNDSWADRKMYGIRIFFELWQDYDFIWVLDCDTLITNHSIPFTQLVDYEHDIFITQDVNGINAGSWIIRNTPESLKFVETIIDNFDAPHEQILMNRYLDMVKVKYLPHPSINSYKYELYDYGEKSHSEGQWEPGDLLLHLPGLSLEKRIEIFKGMI